MKKKLWGVQLEMGWIDCLFYSHSSVQDFSQIRGLFLRFELQTFLFLIKHILCVKKLVIYRILWKMSFITSGIRDGLSFPLFSAYIGVGGRFVPTNRFFRIVNNLTFFFFFANKFHIIIIPAYCVIFNLISTRWNHFNLDSGYTWNYRQPEIM